MKRLIFVIAAAVLAILINTNVYSQNSNPNQDNVNTSVHPKAKYTKSINAKFSIIENNYLRGLTVDNLGIKTSSAYFLGEMKSDKAVVPLMNILKNEKDEALRIMAAWSLIKIGDFRGISLVKHVSENCDCKSVKCLCDFFYNHHWLVNAGGLDFEKYTR